MPSCFGLAQAITDHRARLSNSYSSDPLQMDEQNIVMNGTNTTVICPSNGYTFQRNPTQARRPATMHTLVHTAANGRSDIRSPRCEAVALHIVVRCTPAESCRANRPAYGELWEPVPAFADHAFLFV